MDKKLIISYESPSPKLLAHKTKSSIQENGIEMMNYSYERVDKDVITEFQELNSVKILALLPLQKFIYKELIKKLNMYTLYFQPSNNLKYMNINSFD